MECANCHKDKNIWTELHPVTDPHNPGVDNKRLLCWECLGIKGDSDNGKEN